MNNITLWYVLGVIIGLGLIRSGIRGVANRKRFNNLGHLIISIGQIAFGVFGLFAIIVFILKGI